MAMPPRAPKAGPITGRETVRLSQNGKPVLAEVADLSGAGPQGPSAYQVAVANGFGGSETDWLASLKGKPGNPGASSTVAGPAGASAYEVAKAAGFTGSQADWLASLKGLKGDVGAPVRMEIVTVTSDAAGKGTIAFPLAFAAVPVLVPLATWAGAAPALQLVLGTASDITVSGAKVLVLRSRGALLLTAGPFEVAPAGVVASFLVLGR